MLGFESVLLNQIHDSGGERDEKSRVYQDKDRRVNVDPIAPQNRRNRLRRIVEQGRQVRDERHDEDQREHKQAQGSDPIPGVRDQETQRRKGAEKRKRLILLSKRQV